METARTHLSMPLDGSQAGIVLDALGGTVAVSRLTFTPITTVHNWRRVGMSEARFDHVRLAADARGKAAELEAALSALDSDPMLPFPDGAGA